MNQTAQAILARWRLFFLAGVLLLAGAVTAFSLTHNKGYMPDQPIAFSHKLHAGELGMDCLYCHTSATKSKHSSVPSVDNCMGCHTVVRTDSPEIQKLTDYYESDEPVPWVRIHSLPDHAYFNHAQHINAGISCQTCHGAIETMEVVYQYVDLSMGWCMSCHRSDEFLRTPESIAQQAQQTQYAHSYYRTGGLDDFDDSELREKYKSVTDAFWDKRELAELSEEKNPYEMSELISRTLGYNSYSDQHGTRGWLFDVKDHVEAFQNASINCNVCHQ